MDYGVSRGIIRADEQTMGKGRFNRTWESDLGGLWFNLITQVPSSSISKLPCLLSTLIVQRLNELDIDTQIKWPNDIYILNQFKVAGFLIDLVSPNTNTTGINQEFTAVIGIGINVENCMPKDIPSFPGSNLSSHFSHITLQKLRDHLIPKLLLDFEKEVSQDNFNSILSYYNQHLLYKDQLVKIEQPNRHPVVGKVKELNSDFVLELYDSKFNITKVVNGSLSHIA